MKFALPVIKDSVVYTDMEFKKLKTGTIVEVKELVQEQNEYLAIIELIKGCTKNFTTKSGDMVDDIGKFEGIIRHMPYIVAEQAAFEIAKSMNADDPIEGVENCPRCGKIVIFSKDKMKDIRINFGEEESFAFSLEEEVIIKGKEGEVVYEIGDLSFHHPTINDCISADSDGSLLYSKIIDSYNGVEADRKFRNTWGDMVIKNLGYEDVQKLDSFIEKYGLVKTVPITCRNCKKKFLGTIKTSNFFDLGTLST